MQQKPLLLPMICIAEVIDYFRPEKETRKDTWYMGIIEWRGSLIPLISFERFNGYRFTEFSATAKIAIMNKTLKTSKYNFYGVVIQGVPQPLTLAKADIFPSTKDPGPGEASRIIVRELPAAIPNLELIEKQITQLTIE